MNNNFNQMTSTRHASPHFKVSSSTPNDINYKLEMYLFDAVNFSTMFSVDKEDLNKCLVTKIPIHNGKNEDEETSTESGLSGYCSRTSSTASNVSSNSSAKSTIFKKDNIINSLRFYNQLSDKKYRGIQIYFSSLSTKVICCKTATRVYQLDDLYELGLREVSNRLLNWQKQGDGVLFLLIEKKKRSVKTYLCLASPDNCLLYFKMELTKETRINSIRPGVKYLYSNYKTEINKVYGLFFVDDLEANEFVCKIHNLLDSINDTSTGFSSRKSSLSDSTQITWINFKRSTFGNINNKQCLISRSNMSKNLISSPINFENTLHIPLDSYLEDED